jgi:hypothetical protein
MSFSSSDSMDALLNSVQEQLDRIETKLESTIEALLQLHEDNRITHNNQVTIYGRQLITRKNLLEMYEGKPPSMSANEQRELEEERHPPLVPYTLKHAKLN